MATEIRVPELGESVTEATIAQWFKKPGDAVAQDEPLVELETDKVTVEVPAPAAGTLGDIAAEAGDTVEVGALLGSVEDGAGKGAGGGGAAKAAKGEDRKAAEGAESEEPEEAEAEAAEAAEPEEDHGEAEEAERAAAGGGAADAGETVEITVPALGESVTEATISQFFKKEGESVAADEPIVELETDKVSVEVPAPSAGTIASLAVKEGDTVEVGGLIGTIATGEGGAAPEGKPKAEKAERPQKAEAKPSGDGGAEMPPSPAARKRLEEAGLTPDRVAGSGKRGQVLKGDVLKAIEEGVTAKEARPAQREARPAQREARPAPQEARAPSKPDEESREERVKMTRLRQTIARRLKDAQNTAAMLTTFNDVDMQAVMDVRKEYKELFEKKHGVKLGFMGFFTKAVIQALKEIPAVNAEIDGTDIVYKNYYHIGVAVGTDKGLVVPVVRDADRLSLAGIEAAINDLGKRARDGQLKIEDMQGGTFTISNGGVYGSLLSTPILNAPQSGVLGMHRIDQRPVAIDGRVEIRPMMYLALSYDHRLVDGKEAVTFLVRIKEAIEDPRRLLLDL